MVYPTLTDNFNLATLNANFLELYNQMNVKQSYTPTATNLGTITLHRAMVKSGIGRYKLQAKSGTWVAWSSYLICTLPEIYRPSNFDVFKPVLLVTDSTLIGYLFIRQSGKVQIQPSVNMTNQPIVIDETYMI